MLFRVLRHRDPFDIQRQLIAIHFCFCVFAATYFARRLSFSFRCACVV